jgi:ubiquinone/menaquinone biosynthesis C-methylase UbiE
MTLKRVLETEVMNTADEARDYDDMDHSEVNRAFVDDLLAVGEIGTDVLDIGTGTARIPIVLCQSWDDCRVMAAELSFSMLDLARLNIEIAGLIDRIQLDHVDAKQMHYADAYFDVVMSNSLTHHLEDPLVALRESLRVVRPGGLLFFRDLLRPDNDSELESLMDTYASEANEHQRTMFRDSLLAALSLEEARSLVAELGFPGESLQATTDRHWTWCARKPTQDPTP